MLLRPASRPSCRLNSLSRCRLSRGTSSLPRIRARLRMPNHFLPRSRLSKTRSTWLNVLLPALTHFNPEAFPRGQVHPIPLREWICPRPCNLRVPRNSLHPIRLPRRNSPQPLNLPMQRLITAHSLFSTFGTGGSLSRDHEIRLLLAAQGILSYSLRRNQGFVHFHGAGISRSR